MNELDVAKAIRDGTAPSPSRCGKAFLFDIRISGAGIAARPALGETAYRPPEVWTSPEMQQRAAGLPVIFGHPKGKTLDGQEYAARVVGAVVLPYVRDSELRGIARVFDEDAAAAMASGDFSTSPSAAYANGENTKIAGKDGTLLVEGDPSLLDHVAVVPNRHGVGGGVWDKGGPANGIRNDSISTMEGNTMADNTEKTPADEHGKKLDEIMTAMGGIADMCASMGKRLDALEKPESRADFAPPGGDKHPGAEPGVTQPIVSWEDRQDAENRERAEKADIQNRCDSIATAHGERAPAPMLGEKARDYRIRLLRKLQRHSVRFGKVDLAAIPDGVAFDGIEECIRNDALEAAAHPTAPEGVLREIRTRMPGGGEVVTFVGEWDTAFAPFRVKPRKFVGVNQERLRAA
jgi:hypothetical protein